MDLETLMGWEQRFSELFQANPFATQTFERELRRLSRDLQEGAGQNARWLSENRIQLVRPWLEKFGPTARHAPPLWQGLYFGLSRFVLDPQLEGAHLTAQRLPQLWGRLDELGHEFEVPASRALLGIAERARRATRSLERIRGQSPACRRLKEQIWTACFGSDLKKLLVYESLLQEHNVLILGPTGSGKELVAQSLLSAATGEWKERKSGSLQWEPHRTEALNLAEFPRDLMAAQIVGYKRGSYTGAVQDFRGVLSRCDQGVVFLDEIGELPVEGQVVLLRSLETKRVRPLGAAATEEADCRVIAATHSDLENPEACPDFRRDLFYRIAGSIIRVPSLAHRREDLLPIALGFLDAWGVKEQASLYLEDPRHRLTQWLDRPELHAYSWPGNVRELKRVAAQILMGDTSLFHAQRWETPTGEDGPPEAAAPAPFAPRSGLPQPILDGQWSMEEVRLWYIRHVLKLTDGRQKEAARRLKIHRTTIYHATKKDREESSS